MDDNEEVRHEIGGHEACLARRDVQAPELAGRDVAADDRAVRADRGELERADRSAADHRAVELRDFARVGGSDWFARWNKPAKWWPEGPGWGAVNVDVTIHVVGFGLLICSGRLTHHEKTAGARSETAPASVPATPAPNQ